MKSRDKCVLVINALLIGFILNACMVKNAATCIPSLHEGNLVNDSLDFSFTGESGKYRYHDIWYVFTVSDVQT